MKDERSWKNGRLEIGKKKNKKIKKKVRCSTTSKHEIHVVCSCLKLRNTHSSHILHYKVIKCTLYIK